MSFPFEVKAMKTNRMRMLAKALILSKGQLIRGEWLISGFINNRMYILKAKLEDK